MDITITIPDYDIKVPTCPVARTLALKERLVHYRQCSDVRCQLRAAVCASLRRSLSQSLKNRFSKP